MADMMIPEGWKKTSIGEITSTNSLFSDGDWVESKDQDPTGANRLIQLADIGDGIFINKSSRYMNNEQFERLKCTALEKNDILIARMPEPLGRACLYPLEGGKAATVVDVAILRTKNANHYWLMSAINSSNYRHQIDLNASGTTRTRIARGILSNIEILEPPLPEQQKIATILTSVDTVIEKTRAQIDKLKDLKTGMMQQLLTQGFGHTEFKDSPVGRIPKAWAVAAIADIARLTSGGTPNRENSDYWNGDVLWVKTGEINYQTILDTEEKITVLGLKESSAKLVPAGAILMAMYGQGITRGKVAKLGVPAAMNQACLAMIPNNQVINDFLYYFLSREYFNLRSMVQEGAQKNLSASIVKEILLPVPPRKEQQKIVDVLQSIDTKIMTASQKLISVEQTKKALMQDLLTGKVRVETTARC